MIDAFDSEFTSKLTQIQKFIHSDPTTNDTVQHFNHIHIQIAQLQKFVSDSKTILKCYHIEKYNNQLQDLVKELKCTEQKLLPKKRFGFKTKLKTSTTDTVKETIDGSKSLPEINQITGFHNRIGENLLITKSEIDGKAIGISNMKDCTIKLFGNPSVLQISNVLKCTIITGPVSSAILADHCMESTLVIACRQLRLHASSNLDIYLYVGNKGILEDCNDIRVASYTLKYADLHKDFEKAGLDPKKNNCFDLEDFNWLHLDEPSPNWRRISSEKTLNWT